MILLERGVVMPRADDITAYLDPYPPIISELLPVSGTRLDAASRVTFSVQDSIKLVSVVVSAEHGGVVDLVYDGDQFFGGYVSRSVVEQIAANALTFRIGGDWRGSALTLRVVAIDNGGNVTRAEGSYPLSVDYVAPPTGPGLPSAASHSSLRTFRDAIREISPWWLRGPIGGSVLYAIGAMIDGLADALRAGVKMRFPGFYSNESLTLIGRERRIRRGRYELDETYAARLIPWLDRHRTRGGPYALLGQVHAYYRPNNFAVELRYASGRRYVLDPVDGTIARGDVVWTPPGGASPLWARWWLLYAWPVALEDDGIWSDPGTWDDGGVWDTSMSAADVRDVRAVPRDWNAAHAIGRITLDSSAVGGITITISVEAA